MERSALIILAVALATASGARVSYKQCEDGSLCPDSTTCCQTAAKSWACCPYEFAQCCQDGVHCCPSTYRCDVANGTCVHVSGQERLFGAASLEPVPRNSIANKMRDQLPQPELVPCPDGSDCNDGQTCCLLSSGGYGCCPYANAQCCSDHASCCPEGYRCMVSTHQCVHATSNHTVALAKKVNPIAPAPRTVAANLNVGNTPCPDGSYCGDRQTCCLLTSGKYGCCPYPYAECCSDHESCCPEGYLCKVSTRQCIHAASNRTVPMVRKVNAIRLYVKGNENKVPVGDIRCPDGNYCQDGQTCCLLASGQYGCCPYSQAQCCSDHLSCCPEGYRCKVSTHQCVHASRNHTVAMARKLAPLKRVAKKAALSVSADLLPCPDGSYCQNTQTCCLLSSGKYGCCPYSHAECCSDHLSCCPEGYRCRVSTHQCVHATSNHSVALARKVDPIIATPPNVEADTSAKLLPCPDGSYCQNTQTCCLLTSGRYGCCPYSHAECCSDHLSCCPEGYQCKVSTHQCIHATSNHSVAMSLKLDPIVAAPPKANADSDVELLPCPDGSYCQNTQTCCLLTSGRYGCCPYSHAECCSDHLSCCPEGYRCRVSTHQCVHATSNHSVAMAQKVGPIVAAPQEDFSAELLPCPDGSYCQNAHTCCLLTSGRYGCCPYTHATCCSDHLSCCPEGYRCKVSTHQCIHATSNHSVAMAQKLEPVISADLRVSPKADDVICPDGHKCLTGQTCCQLEGGRYGCCPLPNAVCCEDHKSCCPAGYVCHVSTQTCQIGDSSVPMVQKVPAFKDAALIGASSRNELTVMCPDGSECDDDQTCCQLKDGSYGCCVYSQAVCCDDQQHCCPQGYMCDTAAGRCLQGDLVALALPKVQARRRKPTLRILEPTAQKTCPDKSFCPDRMTCCKSNSTYVCCPFSEAVCCSDQEHCCPKGFRCDAVHHRCVLEEDLDEAPLSKRFSVIPRL